MTTKESYEYGLMEIRKAKAPSIHLEDWNYWWNKGKQEYCNERYNLFATTQQLTDDLAALTTSAVITLTQTGLTYTGAYTGGSVEPSVAVSTGKKYGSDFYRFKTPDNYWHMLGSHVTTFTRIPYKCYPAGSETNYPSKRLTANIANGIMNNSFLRPDFKRPYHSFGDDVTNTSVRPDLFFYVGNMAQFGISSIYIDYLKEPAVDTLTVQQRDLPVDTSDTIEFPEYVCAEILKRVVKLILEVSSDPRLNTQPLVNKTIP
jgi:hypothetical protein